MSQVVGNLSSTMSNREHLFTVNGQHTLECEPSLPIYIGISIHVLTRSKNIIQQLYQVGISMS